MSKRSNGRYSKEFRNESVKMVTEVGQTAYEQQYFKKRLVA